MAPRSRDGRRRAALARAPLHARHPGRARHACASWECVTRSLHAPSERRGACSTRWRPAEIVTLTVTEKAYRTDAPVIALLREGLARRSSPATVLSLDNLPRNGEVLARIVGDARHSLTRARWSTASSRRPTTLALARRRRVGRAVPAVGDRGLRRPAAGLGCRCSCDVQRAARGAQAAAAQRHPLAAGLPRGRAWARSRSPTRGREPALVAVAERLATEDLAADLAEIPGIDVAEYRATALRALVEPGHRASAGRRSRSTATPSSRPASPSRARLRVAAGHPPRWIALVARRLRRRGRDPGPVPARGRRARARLARPLRRGRSLNHPKGASEPLA